VSEVRWSAGDPLVRSVVEDWWVDPERPGHRATVLRDNPRRRLVRIDSETAGTLLVKHYRLGSGRHPLRERVKGWLGRSPADREFRTLARLREAGVAVPPPLARGALPGGDRLIVTRWIEGETLAEALVGPPKSRRQGLLALGSTLAGLHERGWVHGDLHGGNVLVTARGPVLLDLQHAGRARGRRAHARDLARLEHSLWAAGVPLADRVRTRAAALRLTRPFDARARAALRRVGRAATARFHEHAESRHRRAARPGRRFGRIALEGHRGLRLRTIEAAEVAEAWAAHRQALARDDARVLKNDGRSRITAVSVGAHRLVVKEVLPRGPGRRLADAVRGSAGRRAWLAGHGLAARFLGVATPQAYLERRVLGVPVSSLVLLEDLRPARPADALEGDPAHLSRAVEVLGDLAASLHARGVDHGDLKASHVYLDAELAAPPRLLDLEGVRFARRVPARRRRRALAQLNASLPDRFPGGARLAAFERYARRLPLGRRALRRVVARSRARRHRWTGRDCSL
jgi:tRNA A-37 threonylcarbamoyl transferase component Bud32